MAHINNIFNFLKDYNELSNPVITEIEKQKWSIKLSNLPQITEIWSIYDTQDFDGLKILEVKRPVLEPCPAPNDLLIEWLIGDWKKLNTKTIQYKEVMTKEVKFARYICKNCSWVYNPQQFNQEGKTTVANDFNSVSENWVCPECGAKKTNFKYLDEVICSTKEKFIDLDARVDLYNEWTKKRNRWRTQEIPKEQGLILYNNLFKLYSDIKKESESIELLLGDGHIYWNTDLRIIDHPVLLQKVQLIFNPDKPSFTVKCDELKTELYTPMLRVIPTINQKVLSQVIQDIEVNNYHIADTSNTCALFQRLINVVDEKGKLVEVFENGYNGPVIMSNPILFLRKRTLGFSSFIDNIISDIENKPDIELPDFFENIIGNHKEHNEANVIDEDWNQSGIDQDILLTLPANNEQLKIIKYINNYGAVLVQGPPGTGKTHTIANLIGHLLSQGNSVLVTSHTEKALTVLKEKVYKDQYNKEVNLQNLCISLLSTSSQKQEMDDAINEIEIKSTSLDLHESKNKIERLHNERNELINKSKAKSQELLQIRSLEYKDIVFANQTITPIDAAKFINSGQGKFDYIPGKTKDDTVGLPLSMEDLNTLYHSNQQITLEEDKLLSKNLPTLESLWSIDDFKNSVDEYLRYSEELMGWNPKLVLKDNIEENILSNLLETAIEIGYSLTNMENYQSTIIEKSIKDSIYCTFWETAFEEFDVLIEYYDRYRKLRFENDYNIPSKIVTYESISILNEIIDSGKEAPVTLVTMITKPKWKKLKDEITNDGKVIENRVDFENVKFIINYELQKTKILKKFNKLLSKVSENAILTIDNFEEKVKQKRNKIFSSLSWYKNVWLNFTRELYDICSNKAKFEEINVIEIEKPIESISLLLNNIFIPDLDKRRKFELLGKIKNDWTQYANYLNEYKEYGQPFIDLIQAIINKDTNTYTMAYGMLSSVLAKKDIYLERSNLLRKLEIIAPDWGEAIRSRDGIHGDCMLPENIELAWKWRQLSNQIARIDSYDANAIQKELSKINELLMSNARTLAFEKAWYQKIKNISVVQTQAIEGWRATIKLFGKGTGKTAPALIKEARELMPLCQTAIPVWIMPLNRVVENFDPRKNKFDVVIIDEASQAGILALAALYLGKKVIIVGDDEQVSPDTVGIKIEEVGALIEQHLQGIPNKHLFNGKISIYDIAKTSGFKPIMLTEHFRCLPEIIEFSNQLSYNGRIKPLRDGSKVKTKPALIEYRVPNAYKSSNKVNKVEAEHIASLICACCEEEVYKNKTIGVISLLGHEQSYEIDRFLQVNLDPKEYENRKIQCATASQFQGDERDIIFLSIVEGPSEKDGPVRLLSEDGNNDINRKKYNVAASRAKDQMWVVHSLNPEIDLKPNDIRLRLIRHAINPSIDKKIEIINRAESDFEKEVINVLVNHGYKVIPQWNVGAYRIDIVIEDGDKNIALECDGEKWHTQDNLPNDLKRQAILERLGWKFIRIRGSEFYRAPEETMELVFKELESYGIRPNYLSDDIDDKTKISMENEIIDRIKRRAEQIRREWHEKIINYETEQSGEFGAIKIKEDVFTGETIERDNITHKYNIKKYTDIPYGKSEMTNSSEVDTKTNDIKLEQLPLELPLDNLDLQLSIEHIAASRLNSLYNKESLHNNQSKIEASTLVGKKEIISKDNLLEFESSSNNRDIYKILKDKGFEVIDNRAKGGALWVVGGKQLEKELKNYSKLGFFFTYSEKGGRATGHKSAWYCKN
ncbi:AAA family ATPase [Ruminiclostridium herbifermentans]|uniref:AAA family ATPase n=1 Tax=Ruminiclostridium herbifermentans TaxID=2488810 RepID=A0A4U7JKE8_9FIRM|nr:AAA domain-containing protein [Ruminiclostridium herbifermentans]QNU68668.1 AAA family ATPase [Ruminiclostridium herbifermentans]